jgi:hypothetical protein
MCLALFWGERRGLSFKIKKFAKPKYQLYELTLYVIYPLVDINNKKKFKKDLIISIISVIFAQDRE